MRNHLHYQLLPARGRPVAVKAHDPSARPQTGDFFGFGRGTGPKGSLTAVAFIWADSWVLATIMDPFGASLLILGPTPYPRLQQCELLEVDRSSVETRQMSSVEAGQIYSAKTGQISSVETGQICCVETGQMSSVETRQMSQQQSSVTGLRRLDWNDLTLME